MSFVLDPETFDAETHATWMEWKNRHDYSSSRTFLMTSDARDEYKVLALEDLMSDEHIKFFPMRGDKYWDMDALPPHLVVAGANILLRKASDPIWLQKYRKAISQIAMYFLEYVKDEQIQNRLFGLIDFMDLGDDSPGPNSAVFESGPLAVSARLMGDKRIPLFVRVLAHEKVKQRIYEEVAKKCVGSLTSAFCAQKRHLKLIIHDRDQWTDEETQFWMEQLVFMIRVSIDEQMVLIESHSIALMYRRIPHSHHGMKILFAEFVLCHNDGEALYFSPGDLEVALEMKDLANLSSEAKQKMEEWLAQHEAPLRQRLEEHAARIAATEDLAKRMR